jgi:hypothetical protein
LNSGNSGVAREGGERSEPPDRPKIGFFITEICQKITPKKSVKKSVEKCKICQKICRKIQKMQKTAESAWLAWQPKIRTT